MLRSVARAVSRLLSRIRRPRESTAELRADAQSLAFASDVLQMIQRALRPLEDTSFSLLDVGARTASGSALLARILHPDSYARIKARVTALDIEAKHARAAHARYPDVEYRVGDLFSVERRFDIVTCSHTLEHMRDPGRALEHLLHIANELVVIAAPYEEILDEAEPNPSGHVYSFGKVFFDRYPPDHLEIYRSPHWHDGDCFVAAYRPSPHPHPDP